MEKDEFTPVIVNGRMLVYVRNKYGEEEGWFLTLEEILSAFDMEKENDDEE